MNAPAAIAEFIPGISPGIYAESDFRAVAEIVYADAGIILPSGKAMLVYSRLAPLVRETGSTTFARYVELIRANAGEQARAVAALTTNHTFFYREAHHFEHFLTHVRPALLAKLTAKQPVRLWSAGCSSGEETWSLVLTLLGQDRAEGLRIAKSDVLVLASDIAPHALARAIGASYPAKDLEPVPAELRNAWVQPAGDEVAIPDAARQIVRFRSLNLQGPWPIKRKFDVIFCRNVMIYFDNDTKERLVSRFAECLLPGGHLYIGHSERVTGPAAGMLEPVGPTIYQRRAA